MKKLIFYINILLVGLLASCNDPMEENVDERTSFTSDLYFKTYGFQTAKMSTLKDESSYVLNLKNKNSESITVSLKVDQGILDDFNELQGTEYKILPEAYYTLAPTLELKAENTSTPIIFNVKKILAELGLEASQNYLVPIKLETNSEDSLNSNTGTQALVHISITRPTLIFDQQVLKISIDDTVSNPVLKLSAKFDFENFDPTNLTFQTNLSKVATYNVANNTNYLMLPTASFSFESMEVDNSKHQVTINYLLDPKLINIEAGPYMLPVDFSSGLYDLKPASTIYFDINFKSTKPVYEGIFNLTTTQAPTDDYSSTQVNFSLAEAAKLLKTTEATLKNNLVFYGINTDDRTFIQEYTATAPGFWFSKNANAEGYNDNSLMYVEYSPDGIFNVGQYPNAISVGNSYKVSLALVYNGLMVRYNVQLNVN